jgi:hypothetical protein
MPSTSTATKSRKPRRQTPEKRLATPPEPVRRSPCGQPIAHDAAFITIRFACGAQFSHSYRGLARGGVCGDCLVDILVERGHVEPGDPLIADFAFDDGGDELAAYLLARSTPGGDPTFLSDEWGEA